MDKQQTAQANTEEQLSFDSDTVQCRISPRDSKHHRNWHIHYMN